MRVRHGNRLEDHYLLPDLRLGGAGGSVYKHGTSAMYTIVIAAQLQPGRSYGGRSKGGIWYFDIPSPNSTVFSVLWPPSIALWGSLVFPYSLVVQYEAVTGT